MTDRRLELLEAVLEAAHACVYVAPCKCGPEPGVTMPRGFKCARCRLDDALAALDAYEGEPVYNKESDEEPVPDISKKGEGTD